MLTKVTLAAGLAAGSAVRFETDEDAGLVAVIPAREGEVGATAVVESDSTFSLHLGGVFEEHELLRPVGRRECTVQQEKGENFLTISLSTGKVKPVKQRGGSEAIINSTDAPPKAEDAHE